MILKNIKTTLKDVNKKDIENKLSKKFYNEFSHNPRTDTLIVHHYKINKNNKLNPYELINSEYLHFENVKLLFKARKLILENEKEFRNKYKFTIIKKF